MKLASSFLLPVVLFLTLATLSCASLMKESSIADESDDENRQLRANKHRYKIIPKGSSTVVAVTSKGKVKRRRSILDLSGLLLNDTIQDVAVQLMSDEQSQTLRMKRETIQKMNLSNLGMEGMPQLVTI